MGRMKKLTQRIFKKYPEASIACVNNDGTVSLYSSEHVAFHSSAKELKDKDWYVYGGRKWLHTEILENHQYGQYLWNKDKCPDMWELHHKKK
jgi:hypothetical protein